MRTMKSVEVAQTKDNDEGNSNSNSHSSNKSVNKRQIQNRCSILLPLNEYTLGHRTSRMVT